MSEVRAQYETMLQTAIDEGDEFKQSFAKSKLAEMDEQDQGKQDRLQKQAEELNNIQLPHDYDTIWGRAGINEEIQLLIRQVTEQLYGLHNEELEAIHTAHKEKVVVLEVSVNELSLRVENLQSIINVGKPENERLIRECGDLRDYITTLNLEKDDLELKRNNAVMLMEEAVAERDKLNRENNNLKSQINELEGLLRTYKKPSSGSSKLILTSSIKPESDEERKARIERERLETINRNISNKYGIDPLPIPVTQADLDKQHQTLTEAADEAARFQTVVQGDSTGSEVPAGEEEVFSNVGSEEIDVQALEERVAALEDWQKKLAPILFEHLGVAL